MLEFKSCPKAYELDQDKAVSPEQTVARVKALLEEKCAGVLAETDRIDTGRLGIPVFVSKCGPKARDVMPTRKQMGKGASPEQAEASALMELVERFSFFTFWNTPELFEELTWSEAEELWPGNVMPLSRMLHSVGEELPEEKARTVLDLVRWRFHPATNIALGREEMVPLDWFKKLNEFNGSSAGNTPEESVLQGACELVERHVCAVLDRTRPELPTIDVSGAGDPVLTRLMECFARCGVQVLLKDFSMGMPVPTVAAVAWDPATFPGMSEIVFTAGTSSSPAKAAIRALTEVAQLAGDFSTGRVYEASGLPKFTSLDQLDWLRAGPVTELDSLPSVEHPDILRELQALARGLVEKGGSDCHLYSVDIRHPDLGVPANYNFVPGFDFRERTGHRSLGLFVGRILAEEASELDAAVGLEMLSEIYPHAYFLPFFKGLLALRQGDPEGAAAYFTEAEPLQPAAEEQALAAFYQAYALSVLGRWDEIESILTRAASLDRDIKEIFNLRGVSRYKAGRYAEAAQDFTAALDIDSGSAPDLANLGLCHKALGNPAVAMDYLATALEMDSALEWARPHLEELRSAEGDSVA
ncbi:MAG: YcaO-like family protein [Desulfovibrionaceae bacterium]